MKKFKRLPQKVINAFAMTIASYSIGVLVFTVIALAFVPWGWIFQSFMPRFLLVLIPIFVIVAYSLIFRIMWKNKFVRKVLGRPDKWADKHTFWYGLLMFIAVILFDHFIRSVRYRICCSYGSLRS